MPGQRSILFADTMADQLPQPTASYEADPAEVDRVLLLYSGGLDTSVMLKWIQERYEAEVVTRSFGIQAIPTYLFVESVTEKGREVGQIDPVAFRAILKRYFTKGGGADSASGGTPATR